MIIHKENEIILVNRTLMSSSVMLFKEPVKRRITIGLSVMTFGIILLSYTLTTHSKDPVERFAILVILLIELSWFLICSKERFFVSFFNFLTFVNIYVFISYISDTLSINYEGSAFVGARIIIRSVIYIVIVPLLYRLVRPHLRRLVEALDKEWKVVCDFLKRRTRK